MDILPIISTFAALLTNLIITVLGEADVPRNFRWLLSMAWIMEYSMLCPTWILMRQSNDPLSQINIDWLINLSLLLNILWSFNFLTLHDVKVALWFIGFSLISITQIIIWSAMDRQWLMVIIVLPEFLILLYPIWILIKRL